MLPQPDLSPALQQATASELVRLLVDSYHLPLRRELPYLMALARDVEAVGNAAGPRGLAEHLAQTSVAILDHLDKEEKILFPMILAGRGALALMPIRAMMVEHGDHEASLQRTRALTFDFALSESSPSSLRDLYQALRRHEDGLNEHIQLENHVLFSRALRGEF